jgi:hypothetical protein
LPDELAILILTLMADGHFPQLENEVPGAAFKFLREWSKEFIPRFDEIQRG